MNGRDWSSLSKQDEERMMKAMKEKMDRDQKQEDEKNLRMRQARDNNISVLRRQMQEKEERQRL